MVTMVYPEHRKVGEDTVIGWAKDELVNAVIAHKIKIYASDDEMDADIARIHASQEYASMTLEEAKYILEDVGAATFGR